MLTAPIRIVTVDAQSAARKAVNTVLRLPALAVRAASARLLVGMMAVVVSAGAGLRVVGTAPPAGVTNVMWGDTAGWQSTT